MRCGDTHAVSAPIMTDSYGSQFMNATLEGYATLSGVRHLFSYSKEENGIVKRANKEVIATFGTSYQTMNA